VQDKRSSLLCVGGRIFYDVDVRSLFTTPTALFPLSSTFTNFGVVKL